MANEDYRQRVRDALEARETRLEQQGIENARQQAEQAQWALGAGAAIESKVRGAAEESNGMLRRIQDPGPNRTGIVETLLWANGGPHAPRLKFWLDVTGGRVCHLNSAGTWIDFPSGSNVGQLVEEMIFDFIRQS